MSGAGCALYTAQALLWKLQLQSSSVGLRGKTLSTRNVHSLPLWRGVAILAYDAEQETGNLKWNLSGRCGSNKRELFIIQSLSDSWSNRQDFSYQLIQLILLYFRIYTKPHHGIPDEP